MTSTDDLRTISSKALLCFGAILTVGLIASAFIVANTVKSVSSADTITVKGLAEKPVTADNARWNIRVGAKGDTIVEAYAHLQLERDKVHQFIKELGFEDKQMTIENKSVDAVHRNVKDEKGNYEQVFSHYRAIQTISIITDDVKKVAAAQAQTFRMDEMGYDYSSGGPEYLVSSLEDIKMSLIAAATQNAFTRATEFAKSGNAHVGAMKSARQGAFYILAVGGQTDDSDYGGVYDKSTIEKVARVVVTINYGISNK